MRKSLLGPATVVAGAVFIVSACSGDAEVAGDQGGVGGFGGVAGSAGSGAGGSGATGAVGGSIGIGGIGGGGGTSSNQCNKDEDCEDGGVCSGGICCPTADLSCAGVCCNAGEFCSFDKCVTPGKNCQGPADCEDDEYCEDSLGDSSTGGAGGTGSGGASGSGGSNNCTQPVPSNGKCIKLPPICEGTNPAPDCIERCEYKPPAGQLDATLKWEWGQANPAKEFPNQVDVWNTPMVARIYDANCDGAVDESDPPNVIFVGSDVSRTCCHCDGQSPHSCKTGVLRMLDGRSGAEIWSLDKAKPGANGFAGIGTALGDVDNDGLVDIVTLTGDGYLAVIDRNGGVVGLSDQPAEVHTSFGWGGGIALGDMNGDGKPEAAFGRTVWTIDGTTITRQFRGAGGRGGGSQSLSYFVDLDGNGTLELLAGHTAYNYDGTELWRASAGIPDGFTAIADLDGDNLPDIASVSGGRLYIYEGATGIEELQVNLPEAGGGPPTIADFDGDGKPEIGVAQAKFYSMMKPNYANDTIDQIWTAPTHDLSSNVTGSSVFDFNGDGAAEVVYNDECFLWVYDGTNGNVLLQLPTSSFTGTEASMVADVDGDGHAELLVFANGVDMTTWSCNPPSGPEPGWVPPAQGDAYRGIRVYGDKENSWVGTRTLWTQHSYFVTNVCDSRDSACDGANVYGSIPTAQKPNWTQSWLNNFRQNVQDGGLFDAPDVTVEIDVLCGSPPTYKVKIQNRGLSGVPAGVTAEVLNNNMVVGTVMTTKPLLAGQSETLTLMAPGDATLDSFARIVIDPNNKQFNECRDDNNESAKVKKECGPK